MTSISTLTEPSRQSEEEMIRAVAYRLWEEEGRPGGRADEHWARATAIVAAELAGKAGTQPSAGSPDWLKRASEPAATREPETPEAPNTLEAITKRIASRSAA